MLTLLGSIDVLHRDVLIGHLDISPTGSVTSTTFSVPEAWLYPFQSAKTVDDLLVNRDLPWWLPKSHAAGYFASPLDEFIYYRGRNAHDEVWLRNTGDPITYSDLGYVLPGGPK